MNNDRASFELEPANRFVKTADGSPDSHHLAGQARYGNDIKALNADASLDSVLYRDIARRVEPGSIGDKKELIQRLSDTDLLSRFLLENLS